MANDNQEARAAVHESQDESRAARPRLRFASTLTMLAIMTIGLLLGAGGWFAYQRWGAGDPMDPSHEMGSAEPTGDALSAAATKSSPTVEPDVPSSGSGHPVPSTPDSQVNARAFDDLQLADRLLASGSAAQSLELYGRLLKSPENELQHARLLYRIAVSKELIGDLEGALSQYRRLVSYPHDRRLIVAGKLGQARVWIRQKRPELATSLLAEMSLAQGMNEELGGCTLFLLGLAYQSMSGGVVGQRAPEFILQSEGCAEANPSWSPEQLLALPEAEIAPPSDKTERIDILYRVENRPEQIQLRVSLKDQPIRESIKTILHKVEFDVSWSTAAERASARRQQAVVLPNASLATFLDSILAPLDLVWTFDGQAIAIVSNRELEEQRLLQVTAARAVRALRRFVAEFPDNYQAPSVHLMLGNAAFHRTDWAGAESQYRQILRLYPASPLAVEANFNLGLVQMLSGNVGEALDSFYQVVDMAAGHPLRSVAYLYAGRLHMESGDIVGSIRPLIRAATLAGDQYSRGTAAVTLASAYLLAENYHAANTVLMEFRDSFQDASRSKAAALLTAMARLRAANSGEGLSQHGRAVVTAINQITPADFFDSCGYLLIGEGMELIGLIDQRAQLYADGLDGSLPEWVGNQLQLRLVDHQLQFADYAAAQSNLDALLEASDEEIVRSALVSLAEMKLMIGDVDLCLASCRELIDDDISAAQKVKVLRVMGRAFESRSQHYEAALCFAGMIPPEEGTSMVNKLEQLFSSDSPVNEMAAP